ncbi:OST-HTH/LOTUS domain-containing protein [Massilia niastensis]|uniref:OST-HTH/LOTUS domain-containing protein n=1 Tax=Massilia niastensis TaxID=544911 RepID=UPI0012EC8175|nr:OST-HTH/LOTUS domain-containing protein [Massilia niastensis]
MKTDLEQAQKDVQRKLGRCMLRLQQYERLLKAMLASMNLKGPPEDLLAARERRAADMRKKTLGTLVKQFTGEHLCAALVNQRVDQEDGAEPSTVGVPRVEISYSFSLSSEAYEETTASLAELVDLRNELVHHLIERFDISEENECYDASLYLDRCYWRIEGGCQQLKAWAMALDEVRVKASSFVQSQTFENAFVHGINPDGTVSWQRSSVVAELRLAERSCQIEGWTPLTAALELIKKRDSAQVPTRYGCVTWRQLLKRSKQFEIKSMVEPTGAGRQTWYRSLAR